MSVRGFNNSGIVEKYNYPDLDNIDVQREDVNDGAFSDIAPEYSNLNTYSIGDAVFYNKGLYTCVVDIDTPEEWNYAHWNNLSLSKYINRVDCGVSIIEDFLNDQTYAPNNSEARFMLLHSGIDLNTGAGISGSSNYGMRSASTYYNLIPERGLLISFGQGNDNWVYSVHCYKKTAYGYTYVFSPTNNALISIGENTFITRSDEVDYFVIQFRCLLNYQDSSSVNRYRILQFEGESGVTPGAGDDTKIRALFRTKTSNFVAPFERTSNIISPRIYEFARSLGASINGDEFTFVVSSIKANVLDLITFNSNVSPGNYRLSFDYSTPSATSGNLIVNVSQSEGSAVTAAMPSRSASLRHFSKIINLPSSGVRVYLRASDDLLPENSTVFIKNISITPAVEDVGFIPPLSSIDSVARNANYNVSKATEASANAFNLIHAYNNSAGLNLSEDNIIYGPTSAFVSLRIINPENVVNNGRVQILFDMKYDDPNSTGRLRVVFCDSSDNALETVELSDPNYPSFYNTKVINRNFPAGTSYVRFGYVGNNSKTYYLKNICVFINEEGMRTSNEVQYPPINKTAVDTIAREQLYSESCLFDGGLFRLESVPESIPAQTAYPDLIAAWDSFMADYPDQITKERIGTSTAPTSSPSERYAIFRYVILPIAREHWSGASRSSFTVGYERTILLTAGCHGNEGEGYWGLLRLMRLIYEEGYKYPALHKLRNHVKYVIIPGWNPYGIQHNQRAMATGGSPYTYFADENKPDETQALVGTLNAFPDLSLWLDFHTDPYAGSANPRSGTPKDAVRSGCYAFAPNGTELANSLFDLTCDFHNMFKQEYSYETQTLFELGNPGPSSHPSYGIGRLPTAILEVATKMQNFPYASGSGQMMKIAEEWYGNCLVSALKSTGKWLKR